MVAAEPAEQAPRPRSAGAAPLVDLIATSRQAGETAGSPTAGLSLTEKQLEADKSPAEGATATEIVTATDDIEPSDAAAVAKTADSTVAECSDAHEDDSWQHEVLEQELHSVQQMVEAPARSSTIEESQVACGDEEHNGHYSSLHYSHLTQEQGPELEDAAQQVLDPPQSKEPSTVQQTDEPNALYSSLDYSHLMQEPTTPRSSPIDVLTPRDLSAQDHASTSAASPGRLEHEVAATDTPGSCVDTTVSDRPQETKPSLELVRDGSDLCEAAARGNSADVHSLLHGPRQIPPDTRNAEHYTPLHLASAAGAVEVVRQLLLAGADSRARAPSGSTPLHTACRSNQLAVVDVLLREGGALINLADGAGKTAVHVAAEFGYDMLLHRLLEHGAAFTRLDEHRRTALQLAVDKCGATSSVTRRLAKQRWTTQLYKDQYRMETRVEWRGVPSVDVGVSLGAATEVRLDGAEVIQAQSEMNDGAFDGVDLSEFTTWLDFRRAYPSLHSRAHGSLQRKLRVGALDTDPSERQWPLRVCFGVDLASGKAISLLTFRHAADFHRELRVRIAVYEAAPLALAPGPPLRAYLLWSTLYEDFRQPTPYCAVVSGWDSTAAAVVAKYGGRGVGRAHAVAICFGILQVLSVLHAARIVHSRVTPETAVRIVGGGTWSLVEFHTALPFGADFGADRLKAADPVYCAPELHHGQGRGVTVVTPAWDVWGVGALLVLLLTGKRIAMQSSVELLGKTDTIADMAQHLQDLPQDPVLLDLVWQLIRYHPRQRIQAAEALRHPAFVAFGFALSSAVDGGLGLGPSFTSAPDLSRTMPIEIPTDIQEEEEADSWSDSPSKQLADGDIGTIVQSDLSLIGGQNQEAVAAEAIADTAQSDEVNRDDEMGTTSEDYSAYSSSSYSDTSSSSDEEDEVAGDESSAKATGTPEPEPEPEPELEPEPVPEPEPESGQQEVAINNATKPFMEQEKTSFNVFERKKRVLCAVHIQRVTRGHLARGVVRAIHDEIRCAATVAVQAVARGWLTRRSPSAAMVSAVTAAAKSGIMVESPTQLPRTFSAEAPPPTGSRSTAGSPEQPELCHQSPQSDKPESERPVWLKIIDRNTQKPYYWNRVTEEVQWDAPIVEEDVSERDRRIAAKTRYYSDFIGPADAAVRAEVEVDEELDAEEQEKLKGTKDEMKLVFDRIDENGNGYLDAEELRKLAGIIDPDGLSSEELEAALSLMDEDGDDEIDFEEFFDWWSEVNARTDGKMFAIFDQFRAALKAEAEAEEAAKKPRRVVERFDDKKGKLLARTLRNELGDMFAQSGLDMKEAFRAFDADGDGTITQAEFKAGLRSLQLKITEGQIDDLVSSIDQDGDGNLDYLEFVEQFQLKGAKGKSSALAKVIYREEERLGYHDGAETAEELAEVAAAELKRIEATDEDYDTPGDGQGGTDVTVVNDDGTVEVIENRNGGEATEVPPLTPFRVCTASMPLPPQHSYESASASCPRLFCVLPSQHAKPRPEGVVERKVLGGGFLEEDNWRGDTFQLHLLCEWGCGHWLDAKAGLPLSKPNKVMKTLAPALRPNHEYLVKSGVLDRCPFAMPSAAIARELARSTGVSELAMQGSMMAGSGFDLASFTDMVLSTAEQSGALPTDNRPDPRADDPGAVLLEEQIGSEQWNGPLPDDPQAPPTMGGGTGLGSADGSVLGGVLGSTVLSGGLERDMATNGRMSAVEESLRQEAALPHEATTFESMLGMHPAAVTARKRYVRALIEFHELLQACGVVDLSWQASETSLTSGQLMARRAWKYKNPDFRFSRSLYNPRRGDPGPTEAEIIAAERAEHAKKMRAMAAQAEAQKGMEPDHPIERWNLVILSEKGPRYRGLAKGEIGEVISSKYKGEFRVKCPNGTVAYFREEEINYWDEGEENKRIAAERKKGVGHLEDLVIKDAGGIIHDFLGRPVSEVDPDEAAGEEDDDDFGGGHKPFAPQSSRVSSSCALM